MEQPKNRMATTRNRGRPTLAEVAARKPPETPTVADIPNPQPGLPPIRGFVCLGCGVAQNPKVYQTKGLIRCVSCSHCGTRMRMTYSENATAVTSIQRI